MTFKDLLISRGYNPNKTFGYNEFKALPDMVVEPLEEIPDVEVRSSDKENLFAQIYAVNPTTGLPDGDVAVFMNSNTSPQVRDFIVNELMRPDGTEKATHFDGLSDDELYALSRQHGEDIQAYKLRMFNVIRDGALRSKKPSE